MGISHCLRFCNAWQERGLHGGRFSNQILAKGNWRLSDGSLEAFIEVNKRNWSINKI